MPLSVLASFQAILVGQKAAQIFDHQADAVLEQPFEFAGSEFCSSDHVLVHLGTLYPCLKAVHVHTRKVRGSEINRLPLRSLDSFIPNQLLHHSRY